MSEISPDYVDETGGIRGEANQPGFNNIVYSTWWLMILMEKGLLTKEARDQYMEHISLNDDEYGLYKPKHSHDNTFYKLIGLKLLGEYGRIEEVNLFKACLGVGFFRPWDWILLGFLVGSPVTKFLCSFLLPITNFFLIHSAKKAEKIRPELQHRFKWWFRKKKLIKTESSPTALYKTWKIHDGSTEVTLHQQTDGKHLVLSKLYAFRDFHKSFDKSAKLVHNMYVELDGEDYFHKIVGRYFMDRNQPLIEMSKNTKNILEKK